MKADGWGKKLRIQCRSVDFLRTGRYRSSRRQEQRDAFQESPTLTRMKSFTYMPFCPSRFLGITTPLLTQGNKILIQGYLHKQ